MPAEFDRPEIRVTLAGTELFAGVAPAIIDAVAAALEPMRLPGGELLVAQGDAGDAAYLVLGGRLRVERPRGGRVEVIREVGPGELVGELSLLTGAPRSASVRAIRDTEVGRLPRAAFDALLQAHPALAIRLTRMLAALVAAPLPARETASAIKTVAVRGLSTDAPRQVVAEGLARALAGWGRTVVVSAETIESALGRQAAAAQPGDAHDREVSRWLDRLEQDHTYVVYLSDAAGSTWTRRCQRQADLLLDVAGVGQPPAAPATAIRHEWAARDLVLVHPANTARPSGTSAWIDVTHVGRRHHLRLDRAEDFARLARRISGRAIALALSGGGARGMAHIGVLRAMEELGIPVDELGGTSMGAVVAAQYAAGMSLPEMAELNRHGWQHYRPHRAFTIPFSGMVSHRTAERMLLYMFGTLAFEDCWLETFACAASLTRSRLVVQRTGPVVPALMASIALPGIAPPIVSPLGELLVDGGVLNNLPAAHFTRGADGAIIACNVSPLVEREPGYRTTPGAWQVLRDRLFGGARRPYYPSMFETLSRVAVVSSIQETRRVRDSADVYLQPPVDDVAIFDFARTDEVIDTGYRTALAELGTWWSARATSRPPGRRSSLLQV